MKKQLLALLSALGLAGSSSPASAQVVKGANGQPNTKSESTLKRSKTVQEHAASKQTIYVKGAKAQASTTAQGSGVGPGATIYQKDAKNTAEVKAAGQEANKKLQKQTGKTSSK